MTRVAGLGVDQLRVRFTEPVRFGSMTTQVRELGLVRLVTDDGHAGLGEIASPFLAYETVEAAFEVGRALTGVDVTETDVVDDVLAGAIGPIPQAHHLRAAVETAVLDAAARALDRPLCAGFGGGRPSVAVNGLLVATAGAVETTAARAAALVADGYRTIKVKREAGGEDVTEALLVIRAAVGPDVALRLDLNGDLTEDGAIEWLRRLEPVGLEYVEQPIPAFLGPGALARVRRSVPQAIAADEAVTDADAVVDLLLARACDVLVVKPARVGGPRQAHRIAEAAREAGVGVTISTLYETGVGLAAALHVAATVHGDGAHGLGTGSLLEDDLVGGGLPVRGGRMALPDGPGLGIRLDEAAMERLRA